MDIGSSSGLATGESLSPSLSANGGQTAELKGLLAELRSPAPTGGLDEAQSRFEAAGPALQAALFDAPRSERLDLLRSLSYLGTLPGRPFPVAKYFIAFLESYGEVLEELEAGATIGTRASELRDVLLCFHRSGVNTERLRFIYSHIEQDFPQFENAGPDLLDMPKAVRLCHTMLSTGLSAPAAILVLLRAALREPLMHVTDNAKELRQLKMIEMLLRVDFLHTLESLPRDVTEYLSIVRSLRYYDPELRRDTPLSHQLAFFLRKHKFPSKRHMLGPYALKVCDPETRINFEVIQDDRPIRSEIVEDPFVRKHRHLEAVGWRSIEVRASTWTELETYDAKADHVRGLLKKHDLLDP